MKAVLFVLLVLLVTTGCNDPYVMKEHLFGADEFILDSYKISEGKFSILEMEGKELSELDESMFQEQQDTIREGDVLEIVVYDPNHQSLVQAVEDIGSKIGFKVRGKTILLPELLPVEVQGLTLEEARLKIQSLYEKGFQNAQVFVSCQNKDLRTVELAGFVGCSNIPINGKTRLFDVLSRAQIPSNANLFKSYMIREDEFISVDMNKLLKEGDMSQNIVMRNQDKIYIAEPSAANLMVMGEVGRQQVVNLPSGYISLRQALAEAGGISYKGNKRYIEVIRGSLSSPKIYSLNWDHLIHLQNDSLLLIAGDIVYVSPQPISGWNRFISQLLPTLFGTQ